MAMGKRRRRPKQTSMWVATHELPRTAAHPFYTRLNQILEKADFDGYVESLCQQFYADEVGRPGLPPGRYFRLLLIGYFEGLDAERAIAWRAADSFALRESLGLVLPEAPPDHSTISRTRRSDRSRNTRGGLHVDAAAAGRRGLGQGQDGGH
jgi:transposase